MPPRRVARPPARMARVRFTVVLHGDLTLGSRSVLCRAVLSTSGEQAMNMPLPERVTRARVAVAVAAPQGLKPSLIPFDVIQAYEREVATAEREAEQAIKAASVSAPLRKPSPDETESVESIAYVSQGPADPEVAALALSQVPQF